MTEPHMDSTVRRVKTSELFELVPKIQATTARNTVPTNATPTIVPAPQKQYFGTLGQRHVICINGLPNNGKAFVAKELGWYLEFFHGARVEYFEVDRYADFGSREKNAYALLDDLQSFLREVGGIRASQGGDSDNDEHVRKMTNTDAGRVAIVMPPRMAAMASMDDMQAKEVWDSTWSCTNALDRNWIHKRLQASGQDHKLMFIEIELTDPGLLKQHADAARLAESQKLEVLSDWFKCSYTPLGRSASSEAQLSFLRYRNFRDMETHRMHGYLRMRIAQFLSVLRPQKHTVYLSRHGESTYNVEKKLGGDPGLSKAGDEYAKRLGSYAERCIQSNPRNGKKVAARLWTSSLQRTELTASYIPHPELDERELEDRTNAMEELIVWKQMRHRVYRNLDEIYAGTFDGMTEEEIAATDKRFREDRKVDKLATRYPHGESYLDLITRLEPLIHELHSYEEPLLIVSHQATLRVLRTYLLRDRSKPREKCPSIDIPQHTVMKITWDGWNFEVAPSTLEMKMKTKEWPPSESSRWCPEDAEALLGESEPPIGCEEWCWLGPDPKMFDG
eukprot:CAMPEP_0119344526 /NCGR_PEP_ID=MMETSP1333-20130426/106990_1 /TAXON_ID=418940 /ORGANISM="Scyphosphaera apsteinii, Strain RCC1455" /LENGTH=561 /DNA_ID=CAMNT_0007356965 /DNA_START=32 /DNA_END=1717 /DNA_ORIENTATION=-